jgi:hypothetical protein
MAQFTRLLFGSLLLAAAVLKFWQIATTSTPSSWSLTGTAFQWGIPISETVLALWLFSGKRPLTALGVTTAGFVVFSGVTLFKLSQGETSCGCFGNWMVHPKITYWIDIAAVLLGAATLLRARSAGRWRSWAGIVAMGAVVLGVAFGLYTEAISRAEDKAAAELAAAQAAEINREENSGRRCCPW